jgi:hypothetical protein
MKAVRRHAGKAMYILNLCLEGVVSCFISGERVCYAGGWVGSRGGLDMVARKESPLLLGTELWLSNFVTFQVTNVNSPLISAVFHKEQIQIPVLGIERLVIC